MGDLRSYRIQPDTAKSIRVLSRRLQLYEGQVLDLAVEHLREEVEKNGSKGR